MYLFISTLLLLLFVDNRNSVSASAPIVSIPALIYPDIVLHNISDRFLSVTIDTQVLKNNWEYFNISSPKVLSLARGLSPLYLRIGGTLEDFLYFQDGSDSTGYWNSHLKPFNVTGRVIDQLFKFASLAKWDVVFGLNMLNRQNGTWNPDNVIQLLKYISRKHYKVAGLELGNEPDVYQLILPHRPDPRILAKDLWYLRSIMDVMPHYRETKLLGPDVTNLCVNVPAYKNFLTKYLDAAHPFLDAVTLHQYYLDGKRAKLADFYNVKVMDVLKRELDSATEILTKHAPGKKLWLGETSAAWDSGAANISNAYIAGFLWLDKLGLAAQKGVEVVMRQDFYGGNYGLIQYKNLGPNPDYWLSILYKTLVGGPVLETFSTDITGHFRLYSHCTNLQRSKYNPGSVTVYFLNIFSNQSVAVQFPQYSRLSVDLYLLEPTDGLIKSRNVKLNGVPLALLDNHQIPSMKPKSQKQPIIVPPLTLGFMVLPEIKAKSCLS
ncbi:heparanase-like [Argonauta hians]